MSADPPQILWRMQGPTKVVSAALFRQDPEGTELRVFFEPDTSGELLSSQFEKRPHRVKLLERRAGRLRDALKEQGWVPLPIPSNGAGPARSAETRTVGPFLRAGAIGLGLIAVAGWGWHRRSQRKGAAETPAQRSSDTDTTSPRVIDEAADAPKR